MSEFKAGQARIPPCAIKLKEGVQPVKQPIRSRAFKDRDIIQREVQNMIASGVIRESVSPWASPIQLIMKKDGTVRFCIDYRTVNTLIEHDAYPLPLIGDLIVRLADATIFSTLDLKSGYWQIPLTEKSKPVTAFSTPDGHYEFNVLPFGIAVAPAVFQRTMSSLFKEISFVAIYMDDIVVFSKTPQEHEQHLQIVLHRLETFGFKLNKKKCQYHQSEIDYLGLRISNGSMQPIVEKIKAVTEIRVPTSRTEIQSFLGLVNFYRDFCPDLAETSIPLYELTHKNKTFEWNNKHQEAFDKVKQLITNAPLLKIPALSKPFIIATDASAVALGAVLSQGYNGKEHPISFASRVLTEAEKNYSVIEKELLAIVFAIKKFRCYVYGHRFTIFCDHNPLQFIATMKDPTKRIARWLMWLQDYDFKVVYRPGKQNTNADCLSRCSVMALTMANDCDD